MLKSIANQQDSAFMSDYADHSELNIAALKVRARKASDFLKALAHENRLLILCLVSQRERSVTELETLLSLRQPAVSQQLARLRMDGLVATRREGKAIYYSLADEDTKRVMMAMYDMFCRDDSGEDNPFLS